MTMGHLPLRDVEMPVGSGSMFLSASATTLEEGQKTKNGKELNEREARMSVEIHELARRSTRRSDAGHGPLFPVQKGGPLDPNSPQFNARKWARAYYESRVSACAGTAPRTSGVAYKNLDVYGFGTATDFQNTVVNIALEVPTILKRLFRRNKQRIDILRNFEGLLQSGEMLCVLGPPGSGCSTLLRTLAGDTHGFHVSKDAILNYKGVRPEQMKTGFRGEAIYTAEVDHHFPYLSVADTLYFAARCRCPDSIPDETSRQDYSEHLRDVIMAMFGISHTKNTRVGDDFVKGVSGGERKRVTIAEAALGHAPLQCWDNSTRGLDSANAIEFCRTLRTQADIIGCSSCVAIYQAPQTAYELFDKVVVVYEGRQIFFGRTDEAKSYFEDLGFVCPEQAATADFLTSMTNPSERVVRIGSAGKVPRTSEEFAQAWKRSQHRARLIKEIDQYVELHPFDEKHHQLFLESRRMDQSNAQREGSPFNLSYWEQINLTLWRSYVMTKGDPSFTLTMLLSNVFEALIISSVFYNLSETTASFFRRTTLLFFIVLMNAFGSILEIMTLYAKRKIIEKHSRYAFYHPSAEALSAIISDLPYKILNAILLNTILYFMGNLRREAGAFFSFLLFSFVLTLAMSMAFRLIGSVTKSISQALAPASIILLGLILYSGFVIPPPFMEGWLGWIRWINPVFYGLESVFLNEFVSRPFPCTNFVPSGPGYEMADDANKVCAIAGSIPGQDFVAGENYLKASFGFADEHRWRNLGVIIAYMILFLILHLLATEYIASERSKGEILVFTREAMNKHHDRQFQDLETGNSVLEPQQGGWDSMMGITADVERQTSIFSWRDVSYDIQVGGGQKRLLDRIDGWVKPGTLTALMGVSGAGKTTLLDVLASRVTMGIISGEILVDGHHRDSSFQRKTGYVQQQDLHLQTSTVREALEFSALLRQPPHYSKKEKLAYVDSVISLLSMEEYSDAIIGVPGEGLNVEQRKRLTIGVELAARPQLLLFLDEPTSGLDSQTSWSICNLMKELTRNGQAILCTIHQPSAMLFQRFDRLLLLARGGRTVYFGEIGRDSRTLMEYFERNGGLALPPGSNPAEHMVEVIGAAPGSSTEIDWAAVWRHSPEYQQVQDELTKLSFHPAAAGTPNDSRGAPEYREFAASIKVQVHEVTRRVFQQFWRSPSYIYSKFLLSVGTALFIGLSILDSNNTIRGLQTQMFGVFLFLATFTQIIDQAMPFFCQQRTLYEARERPSKAYSWQSFIFANISVEIAWNSLVSVFCFICWYFPIGLYRNAEWTDQVHSRGITIFLHIWMFFIFTSTFGHMVISGLPNPEIGGTILNLVFIMMFAFCGILSGPDELPGFWIFMYRVNPFTYIVESFLGITLANAPVACAENEILTFNAPGGSNCDDYLSDFLNTVGGYLIEGSGSSSECVYCSMNSTNSFLASINVDFSNRWRNFGFMWVYVVFNIAAAVGFYWVARVPKNNRSRKE